MENRRKKCQKLSISSQRKQLASKYWRERAQTVAIIDYNTNMFISQKNIKIFKLDESKNIDVPFSTIISSKSKIIID
ncbi:MAG: hypothetical protein IJ306_07200 [Oscillospiraceae bacterium]|nr:hypothetical protein [Oscillospiraceae bacterium]